MEFHDKIAYLYKVSPEFVMEWIKGRRIQKKARKLTNRPIPILSSSYFVAQREAVLSLISKIEQGQSLDLVLASFPAGNYGERIAEYTYFSKWILSLPTDLNILDVGCVLNNKSVNLILKRRCNEVWFCNPSLETEINISNPVFYHISSLDNAFPSGQRFDIVTCLSTIEHIGYDNSQYGATAPALYKEPSIEPFTRSFGKLCDLTASGGHLLISFPFGKREALVHPKTARLSSQVMDYASLRECMPTFEEHGVTAKLDVYELTSGRWTKVDPSKCTAQYADKCIGAKAVALISGAKSM
jgi:hypothetical protein